MSYAAEPIVTVPPPTSARPPAVTSASALLWLMGAAGLCYAIATIAIAPGTVSRFQDAAAGDGADNFVTVVWLDTALAVVLSILFFALFVVLGLGLRRGSRVARTVSLVICGLGVLGGLASFVTVLAQRSGDPVPGSLSDALGSAYPEGWIGLNVVVAVLQVLGYLAVGLMLLVSPRTFFGYTPRQSGPAFGPQPGPGHPGFGPQPGPGHPAFGPQPGPGYPAFGVQPGTGHAGGSAGMPGAFGSPVAPYGPQNPPAAPFSAPPSSPYGAPSSPYPSQPGAYYGPGPAPEGVTPSPAAAAGGSPAAPSGYAPPVQNSPYAPFGPPAFTPPVPPSADLSGYMPPTPQGSYPPVGGAPAGSAGGGRPGGSSEDLLRSEAAGDGSVGLPTGTGVDEATTGLPQGAEGPSSSGEQSPGDVTEGTSPAENVSLVTEGGGGHIGAVSRPDDRGTNRPAPGSDDEYWRRPSE